MLQYLNGVRATLLMCHYVLQKGLCSREHDECCGSSLTFQRYSTAAGEWALAISALSNSVILVVKEVWNQVLSFTLSTIWLASSLLIELCGA